MVEEIGYIPMTAGAAKKAVTEVTCPKCGTKVPIDTKDAKVSK